ncbi:MAG: S-layer homology domain-containing protein [Oscillospiraceae bacterium]|nr:S-layer homology domain-containing protein [Oscillospiraceae bacterium]
MNALKKITLILLVSLMFSSPAYAVEDYSYWNSSSPYPADTMNTKYHSSVKALIDAGVVTGDTDGLFHPEKPITRAEFAAIAARATHQQNMDSSEGYFTDLVGYGWAAPYINRCYEQNWIRGVGGTLFAPGKDVTYAEAMTILIRIQRGGQREELVGKWPDVYIEYADMYNLTGGVEIFDWNAPAQKGDIAILTNRLITQPPLIQTDRSAYFSSTIISGNVDQPIFGVDLKIYLNNETFVDIPADTNITSWFSEFAAVGLYAKVSSMVRDGMSIMSVEVYGTPNRASQAELLAFIPSYYLRSGNGLSITPGNTAKLNIE